MKKITLKFAALLLGSALASSAFATENGNILSESLILAQDERWRRA